MTLLRSYRKPVSELRNKTRSSGCQPWPFAARFSFLFKMHWCLSQTAFYCISYSICSPCFHTVKKNEESVIITVLWLGTLQEV